MNKKLYIAPEIEVVEVEVEKGFAASPNKGIDDWDQGSF